MEQKTNKIIYWVSTILFAAFMLFSGVSSFFPNEESNAMMLALGYAAHVSLILGVAKVLGSIAILQNKYKTIKEWAYAGFTFDILGASASIGLTGGGFVMALFPLLFLVPMFASYFTWKKLE